MQCDLKLFLGSKESACANFDKADNGMEDGREFGNIIHLFDSIEETWGNRKRLSKSGNRGSQEPKHIKYS